MTEPAERRWREELVVEVAYEHKGRPERVVATVDRPADQEIGAVLKDAALIAESVVGVPDECVLTIRHRAYEVPSV